MQWVSIILILITEVIVGMIAIVTTKVLRKANNKKISGLVI